MGENTYFRLLEDVFMISPLSVTLLVLPVLACFIIWIWLSTPKNLPPGPLLVFPGSRPHEVLTNLSKKFGTVYSISFGLRAVVLNDTESFFEVFVKQGHLATNRNPPPLMKLFVPSGASIAFDEGETWRQLRAFGVMALRQFGYGQKIIIERINEEARILCDDFETHGGKPFDPEAVTITAIANVMNVMLFGSRYEYHDGKFINMMKHLIGSSHYIKITDLANFFPFLYWTPLYKTHRDHILAIRKLIEDIIEQHQQSYDKNDIRDIVDLYLHECKKEGNGMLPHDETLIWRGIYDLVGTSTETTNLTMSWILLYLAKYPDVQKKIHKQLDDVVGHGRQPILEDRDDLPLLLAAITETIRIRPVAPFTQRGATDEIQVNGYTIPKGCTIICNIWAIQHDPNIFPNPDVFDPTRFLTTEGKYIANHPSIAIFGAGLRVCIGRSLAETELYLYTANLLQRFNITLPDDQQDPDMSGNVAFTVGPHPYKLCFTVR